MDFSLTAEQRQITEMVSEFVDEEIIPVADEIDKKTSSRRISSMNSPNSD